MQGSDACPFGGHRARASALSLRNRTGVDLVILMGERDSGLSTRTAQTSVAMWWGGQNFSYSHTLMDPADSSSCGFL